MFKYILVIFFWSTSGHEKEDLPAFEPFESERQCEMKVKEISHPKDIVQYTCQKIEIYSAAQ